MTSLEATGPSKPEMLSIVIPVMNEAENIANVHKRISAVLESIGMDWEIIFSVDLSTDGSEELIVELHNEDARIKMISLSRRFGQPMAIWAGLEAASGDAVIIVDCDLQDPPELIPQLIEKWRDGFEVVHAQRARREGETLSRRIVASFGYRVIRRISEVEIPADSGDFKLISRRVLDELLAFREGHGFLRGLIPYVGFSQTTITYDRHPRQAGVSKYNRFLGSFRIGLTGIVGFSRYPLELISMIGIAVAIIAFLLAVAYAASKLAGVGFPIGNPTIVILISFLGGLQLLALGIIGEYIGCIYDETRQRPKYIVQHRVGFGD